MKYTFILSIFLLTQNISLGQSNWSNYKDSTATKTGLRYDILDHPWVVHFDMMRLAYQTPSIQLSGSYRLNYRFGFESEINYYLHSKIKHETTRLDALSIGMSTQKPGWFISGIGKVYFGDSKTQYIAARLVGGSIHLDLSRKVCTEAQVSTSGEICQCLKTEDRQLTVQKNQFLYGLRYGLDYPITHRIRFNTYIDFAKFRYTRPNYQYLAHACDNALPHFEKSPKTDGIYGEFKEWSSELYFSFGVKIGYAIK